jgi:hypothetical protein
LAGGGSFKAAGGVGRLANMTGKGKGRVDVGDLDDDASVRGEANVPNEASFSRKSSDIPEGLNPLDPKKVELWTNYLGKKGVNFEIGSKKAYQVLQEEKALGVFEKTIGDIETNTYNRTIYLRENFNQSEFYEEVFHALDDIKGLPSKDVINGQIIKVNELRAKESLLNIQQNRINHNRTPILSYEEYLKLEDDLDMVRQGRY